MSIREAIKVRIIPNIYGLISRSLKYCLISIILKKAMAIKGRPKKKVRMPTPRKSLIIISKNPFVKMEGGGFPMSKYAKKTKSNGVKNELITFINSILPCDSLAIDGGKESVSESM